MNNLISVIMPVYNVEKYLKQSIESVCNQTYDKLQIILIDDGSTDNSGLICDAYAQRDDRIIVIHQKNGGAASAKNAGLKVATGEYLAFVDSDDYLESDAYAFMMMYMEKHNSDIIQCGFYNVFCDNREKQLNFSREEEYSTCSYLALFTKEWTCALLWDKLYRRKVFKGIYFEEGHKIDDEFFTYKGVMNSKKIVRVPYVTYNYRQRLSGVMLSKESQEKIIMDTVEYLLIRRKIVTEKFPELKQTYDEHYLNMLVILSKKSSISIEGIMKIKSAIKDYKREKNRIKISFSLWRKLKRIEYCSSEKIFEERDNQISKLDSNRCFE